jgi:glycine/D-amino acid oxidase-like deaminating enzyme
VGVTHEWLTRSQIQQRWPQMKLESDEDGIFEPLSGGIAARRAVQAVVAEFDRRGGIYRQARVDPPREDAIWLDEIALSDGSRASAEQYVFACGSWMGNLFPQAVGERIFATRQEVFFFGVPAGDPRFSLPLLPIWYRLDDEFYGFPDIEGRGVKIASDRHGPAHDPDAAERMPTLEALGAARAALGRILPDLAHAPAVESRVCQYENTPSGDFLIDRHPSLKNVWLVGGGSGHGFKHGPAMGRYVTRLVLESAQPEPRFGLAALRDATQRQIR